MLLRMRKGVGHGEKEETLSSLLFNPLSRSLFLPARLFKNNVGTRAFFFCLVVLLLAYSSTGKYKMLTRLIRAH